MSCKNPIHTYKGSYRPNDPCDPGQDEIRRALDIDRSRMEAERILEVIAGLRKEKEKKKEVKEKKPKNRMPPNVLTSKKKSDKEIAALNERISDQDETITSLIKKNAQLEREVDSMKSNLGMMIRQIKKLEKSYNTIVSQPVDTNPTFSTFPDVDPAGRTDEFGDRVVGMVQAQYYNDLAERFLKTTHQEERDAIENALAGEGRNHMLLALKKEEQAVANAVKNKEHAPEKTLAQKAKGLFNIKK